jgi:diguanylate cyclase (GGDEF)-like protein
LSRFLNAFGYEVQQVADPELVQAALEGNPPDLLIVDSQADADRALELCRQICEQRGRRHIYKFLLISDHNPEDLVKALGAGVDDFLVTPIVYGDLLVRLRAAVRNLEFERRAREQDYVEPGSRLLSRRGFQGRLNREFTQAGSQDSPGSCVVVDLDFLDGINRRHGLPAGDLVLQATADKLSELCGDPAIIACFGGGRFAVWLWDYTEGEAVEWAERTRIALAEMEISAGETPLGVTVSIGVASRSQSAQTPDELVQRALTAVAAAKNSGRNCVARFGQYDDESKAWEELASPGKLFERTLARDVMAPCAALLRSDQPMARAESLLRRTRLNALPVVDRSGKLVGLLREEEIPVKTAGGRSSEKVSDRMTTDVATCDENTSFEELIHSFKQESQSPLIIVEQGRPTGFVTPRILAALSEPLKTDSFASDGSCTHTSDDLVIPEPCLAEEF